MAFYGNDVFESDWNSIQGSQGFAFCSSLVRSLGLGEKIFIISVQEGMNLSIDPVNLFKVSLGDFLGLAGTRLEFA